MKNLIKTLTIGAFLFSTALIPLNAQTGTNNRPPMSKNYKMNKDFKNLTPEEKAQKFTDKISTELQLTEAQKKEVYTLKLSDFKRQEVMRNAQMENRKNSEANFRKILTPEQITKLDALKAKREEHKGQQGPKKPYSPKN